jgi:hypothetical protein
VGKRNKSHYCPHRKLNPGPPVCILTELTELKYSRASMIRRCNRHVLGNVGLCSTLTQLIARDVIICSRCESTLPPDAMHFNQILIPRISFSNRESPLQLNALCVCEEPNIKISCYVIGYWAETTVALSRSFY